MEPNPWASLLLRHSCGLLFYAQSMEDSVPVSAAFLLGSAALGNGGRIQMPDIRSGDPAKRTAIQRGGQIVDAVKDAVYGVARLHPGLLECHMGQVAVMEVGMRNAGLEKVSVFHRTPASLPSPL